MERRKQKMLKKMMPSVGFSSVFSFSRALTEVKFDLMDLPDLADCMRDRFDAKLVFDIKRLLAGDSSGSVCVRGICSS